MDSVLSKLLDSGARERLAQRSESVPAPEAPPIDGAPKKMGSMSPGMEMLTRHAKAIQDRGQSKVAHKARRAAQNASFRESGAAAEPVKRGGLPDSVHAKLMQAAKQKVLEQKAGLRAAEMASEADKDAYVSAG